MPVSWSACLSKTVKDAIELIGVSPEDFEVIRNERETLLKWKDTIVKTFCDKIYSFDETAKIVKDIPRPVLENAIEKWYLNLIEGLPTSEFWLNQWLASLAHVARKVEIHYILAMMSVIQQTFGNLCLQSFEPQKALYVYQCLKRITDTITAIAVEGYMVLYKESLADLSGIKPELIDRMVLLEATKKWKECKSQISR